MTDGLYTIICEFRNGTYISQARASGVGEAVQVWAEIVQTDRPIPRASAHVARNVLNALREGEPVALDGLERVWCLTTSCGGDFVLVNIVQGG
jgi:hypothetical protein